MAHGGSVIAFIEDPDGYKIELVEAGQQWSHPTTARQGSGTRGRWATGSSQVVLSICEKWYFTPYHFDAQIGPSFDHFLGFA